MPITNQIPRRRQQSICPLRQSPYVSKQSPGSLPAVIKRVCGKYQKYKKRKILYQILCFGDSNTHGYNGETQGRFSWEQRWTGILARRLGPEYRVIEEGLNGRTTGFTEHGKKYRDPVPYLAPCMLSHMPLDLVAVMLGTNDTKPVFNASPEEIARSMRRLMLRVRNYLQVKEQKRRVLLISPVPMTTSVLCSGIEFDLSSVEKSRRLAPLYQTLAKELEVDFWDAGSAGIQLCGDGCHFSEQGHRQFAERMEEKVREILFS